MWAGLCLRGPQRSLSTVTVPAACTVYEKGWKLKSCWAKLGSCGRRELHILPPYTLQKIQSRFSLRAGFTLRSDCCSILLEGAHSCPRVLPSFLRAPLIAGGSAVRMTPHQLLSTEAPQPGNSERLADTWGHAEDGASTAAQRSRNRRAKVSFLRLSIT